MRAFLGSACMHVALGALLLSLTRAPAPQEGSSPVVIEMIDAPPAPRVLPRLAEPGGGGGSGAPATRVAMRTPRRTAPRAQHVGDLVTISDVDVVQHGVSDRGGVGEGDREGGGRGGGRGFGRGLGLGDGLAGVPAPPPAPGPPAISKARPPKLIYPARDREVEPDSLFIARLAIDSDGYVVGAKLVHGVGGKRDQDAEHLVWKFRYAPALDADGHPIRASIEQPFMVSR